MFAIRLLAPVGAGVLLLASGCGGGSSPAAPGGPTAPAEAGNPVNRGTPGPAVTMSARSGLPQPSTVSWLGGTSGSTWRLERRREGGGSNAARWPVAEVDAAAGVWPDSGLDADEDVDEVLQSSLAMRQPDGSWWLLPLAAHDRTQRVLRVNVPAGADGQLCIPTSILRDVTVPILNSKPGCQRQWTLQGSPAAEPAFGSPATPSSSGVVYTAPGVVPPTNPVLLRFESTNTRNGQRLVLTARVRVTEDAWVGRMDASLGDLDAGHLFRLDIRWGLDPAQSTATGRVYTPAGRAEHLHTMPDPVCTHSVAPLRLSLAQAQTLGQWVVDESVSPPRDTLGLKTRWNSMITVRRLRGSTAAPFPGGHLWSLQGIVDGNRIEGSDQGPGDRSGSLGRPE